VIAIFKKELETIDMFGALLPIGDVLEHEPIVTVGAFGGLDLADTLW
jgi:hypothetical protein